MSNHLIIFTGENPEEPCVWALLDERGVFIKPQQVTRLSDIALAVGAEDIATTSLILSGLDIVTRKVDLPAKTDTQARAAIPFVLEDEIASSTEALHFALGKAEGSKRLVALIAKSLLDSWLDACRMSGLSVTGVYADYSTLQNSSTYVTLSDDYNTLWQDGVNTLDVSPSHHVIAKMPDGTGLKIDHSLADIVIPDVVAEAGVPISLQMTEKPDWLGGLEILQEVPALDAAAIFKNAAKMVKQGAAINLLQGVYSVKTPLRDMWLVWRRPALMLTALVVVFAGAFFVETWKLVKEIERIDAASERAIADAFPGARNISQARARLRSLQASATDQFLNLSTMLFESVQEQENISLLSIRYDEERRELAVSLNTSDFNDIALIKAALLRRGGVLTEGASRNVDGRVLADVLVREVSQ